MSDGASIIVEYTNYRGETSRRTIKPLRMWWGNTEYHTENQWMLTAYDCEKKVERDFAWQDMTPVRNPATSADPSSPLAALAMRERAAEICDKHSYSNNQYVSMRMIDAASEIRALPTTFTDAELLAAAMRLPQVRALIEAASVFADFADLIDAETVGFSQSDTFALIYKDDDAEYHAENFSLARFTAIRAAIAPFRKGAS